MRLRPILRIRLALTAILLASAPFALAACATGDLNLGLRGNVDGSGDGAVDPDGSDADTGGTNAPMEAGSPEAGPIDAGARPPPRRSSGCGVDPPALDDNIQVGTMRGRYLVDLPVTYDKDQALPLIMAFRGAVVSADAFRGYLDLVSTVGEGAIVVNLDCLNNAVTWELTRDLPYVDALLAKLLSSYCVDLDRIFAVGHSEGGALVNMLGCLRGDKFRAIAPLSGGPGPSAACQGDVAVWITQGKRDVALGAGRASRDFWVQRNGCEAQVPTAVEPSPCVEYSACKAGLPVRYCEYEGTLDLPTFAADGLWQFFRGLN